MPKGDLVEAKHVYACCLGTDAALCRRPERKAEPGLFEQQIEQRNCRERAQEGRNPRAALR